jgi:hypothetical protein
LAVTKSGDGTLQAFLRNPEGNGGRTMGTRAVIVSKTGLVRLPGDPDVPETMANIPSGARFCPPW